jgi:hypothetical protein
VVGEPVDQVDVGLVAVVVQPHAERGVGVPQALDLGPQGLVLAVVVEVPHGAGPGDPLVGTEVELDAVDHEVVEPVVVGRLGDPPAELGQAGDLLGPAARGGRAGPGGRLGHAADLDGAHAALGVVAQRRGGDRAGTGHEDQTSGGDGDRLGGDHRGGPPVSSPGGREPSCGSRLTGP